MRLTHCPIPRIIFWAACAFSLPAIGKEIILNGDSTTPELFNIALSELIPGDQLILAPGEYEAERFTSHRAGTKLAPIIVRAQYPQTAIIKTHAIETFAISHPYWVFDGLVVEGDADTDHAFHITENADHTVLRNMRLTNFNNHIKANGKNGAFPDHLLIENNQLRNQTIRQTAKPSSPIDIVGGRNAIIRGNVIEDFGRSGSDQISYGIFIKGNSSHGLIERNLVACSRTHSNGYRIGISLGGGGTASKYCQNRDCSVEHRSGVIRNNIIMNCSDAGIFLKKSANSRIVHNTLVDTLGIDVQSNTSTAVIMANYVEGTIQTRQGARLTASNNITTLWDGAWLIQRLVQLINLHYSDSSTTSPASSDRYFNTSDALQSKHPISNKRHLKNKHQDPDSGFANGRTSHRVRLSDSHFVAGNKSNLTPTQPQLFAFQNDQIQLEDDFWGNPRDGQPQWIGAIDIKASSCDITALLGINTKQQNRPCLSAFQKSHLID